MLVGTDFNDGVKGIGPKKALRLVQQHGSIESMPDRIREALGDAAALEEVRRIYLSPDVTDAFEVRPFEPDLDATSGFCARNASSRAIA